MKCDQRKRHKTASRQHQRMRPRRSGECISTDKRWRPAVQAISAATWPRDWHHRRHHYDDTSAARVAERADVIEGQSARSGVTVAVATGPAAADARASRSAAAAGSEAHLQQRPQQRRTQHKSRSDVIKPRQAAAFITHHNGNHLTSSAAKEPQKSWRLDDANEQVSVMRSRRMTFTRARLQP